MRIHGKNGQVALADASPAVVLGSLNKWALNMARDYAETTSFGDTNKQWVPGLPDISGTLGGFYDVNAGSPPDGPSIPLFEAAEGETPVTLQLMPSTLNPSHFWQGLAYLDNNVEVAVNGAVTLSGTFKGAGDWARS